MGTNVTTMFCESDYQWAARMVATGEKTPRQASALIQCANDHCLTDAQDSALTDYLAYLAATI